MKKKHAAHHGKALVAIAVYLGRSQKSPDPATTISFLNKESFEPGLIARCLLILNQNWELLIQDQFSPLTNFGYFSHLCVYELFGKMLLKQVKTNHVPVSASSGNKIPVWAHIQPMTDHSQWNAVNSGVLVCVTKSRWCQMITPLTEVTPPRA